MGRERRNSEVYGEILPKMKANSSQLNHRAIANLYVRILTEISLNRFQWVGLPEGIDHRFLETQLLYHGRAVFYYDRDFNRFMVGRAAHTGQTNVYDNPTSFRVNRVGMRPVTLSAKACVPIYSNYLRTPEIDVINIYANKLARIDRTIDINLMHQRHPFVISGNEEIRNSLANAFKQVTDGEFAIAVNSALDLNDSIQAFNTSIHPDQVMNNILAKQKIWNECMTMLGVNNANQDKRERLVADEVAANDEQIMATRGIGLNSRNDAAMLINNKWFEGENVIRCVWGPVPAVTSLGEPDDQPEPAIGPVDTGEV